MPPEMWMLVVVFALGALVLGFLVGRLSAPREGRFRQVEQQLDDARGELSNVRESVDHHFEESARLFGELARDYRALFGHFADSARRMGYSDDEARELLRRANRQLAAPSPEEAPAPEDATAEAAAAAPAGAALAEETPAPAAEESPAEAAREIEEASSAAQEPRPQTPDEQPAPEAAKAGEPPAEQEEARARERTAEEELESQEQPIRRGD